ncbi:MAG: replication initiator protein A [Gammaproteobacteria bacterium]|nr:replication initiator protein A [Gammaproteobacteria bacterium]
MVPKTTKNDEKQLSPLRYPQGDFFICDVADAVLKDITQEMEHPFYSLSKKPDTTVRRYEHNGNWIEIRPDIGGAATIYDKDILIFAISQLMAKKNRGEAISRTVRINSKDLLIFTNRGTSGRDYMALQDSLDRLQGTKIRTNIQTGDEEEWRAFNLIDEAGIRRKNGIDGRLLWCDITLSNWMYQAVENTSVLTLHPDYFRLRKPIERRIYELGRKHCGRKDEHPISIDLIYKKSGSRGTKKRFKQALKEIAERNSLPDYAIEIDELNDKMIFINRKKWWEDKKLTERRPYIQNPDETYEKARSYTLGQDVYAWESDWITHWIDTGCPPLTDPDKAFIGFCRNRYARTKQGI